MSVSYTWSIPQMDCHSKLDDEENVVLTVHWTLIATGETYSSNAYGTVSVAPNPDTPFTPYEKLTFDQVVGWVKAEMGEEGVDQLYISLTDQIVAQMNPPVVTPPLPWSQA